MFLIIVCLQARDERESVSDRDQGWQESFHRLADGRTQSICTQPHRPSGAFTRSHTLTHTDTYTKCTCSLDLESYETKSKSKGAPKASTCHAHTRKIQARKHMLPYLYGTQISTQYTHSQTHTHRNTRSAMQWV